MTIPTKSWRRRTLTFLLTAIPVTALALLFPGLTHAQAPMPCSANRNAPTATLTLIEGESTELRLGRRKMGAIELEFAVAGCRFPRTTKLRVDTRLFRKDAASLDRDSLDVTGEVAGDEAVVTLIVRRDDEAEPGRYDGAVVVEPESKLTQSVKVPLSITVQYRDMRKLAWLLFVPTLVLGTLVLYLKGLAAGGADSFLQTLKLRGLALDAIAVGVGTFAALGAWKSEYLNNPTWGSGDPFWDGVDVFLVMLAAYIAAATGATIGTDAARRRLA